MPFGHYAGGLWQAPDFARLLGIITSEWSRAEEEMILVFHCLLGSHTGAPTRQIYRSIISASARIKMMRAALEESIINKDRNENWDAIIDKFARLNAQRNKYVHGLWDVYVGQKIPAGIPDPDTIRVFLRPTSIEENDFLFGEATEVELKELDDLAQDIGAFVGYATRFSAQEPLAERLRKREQASQKKRPQPD